MQYSWTVGKTKSTTIKVLETIHPWIPPDSFQNHIASWTLFVVEWTKLSEDLPSYGGATYIRWCSTTCPLTSNLLYKGRIAGPDYRASGGGANYLCLTDDPEYYPDAPPNVPHSTLRCTQYQTGFSPNMFEKSFDQWTHQALCVACETERRVSVTMISAVTRCPTSDWILEYQGYLMSPAERQSSTELMKDFFFRGEYICVDKNGEFVTTPNDGGWTSYIL